MDFELKYNGHHGNIVANDNEKWEKIDLEQFDEQFDWKNDENMDRTWKSILIQILNHPYMLIIGLILVAMFLGLGTPLIWNQIWLRSSSFAIESDLRYDCSPLRPTKNLTKNNCNLDICVWDEMSAFNEHEIACYYRMEFDVDIVEKRDLMPRYQIVKKFNEFHYILQMLTKAPFILNETNDDLNLEPVIHHRLSLTIQHYNEKHFSVLIKPELEDEKLWSKHFHYNYGSINNSIKSAATISVENDYKNDHFQLRITRNSNNVNIFDMGPHTPFIFTNGHIEITLILNTDLVYGLGQSNQPFKHNFSNPAKWNLFNQYHHNLTENTTNYFGTHPFYMAIDDVDAGSAFGVLLVNSFPIEIATNSRPSLTIRTIGGHLEFHYFLGPKPIEVIKQLSEFIYRPAMPPYWSLGFHMCHSNCSLPKWSETIGKLQNLSIPVESDCGTSMKIDQKHFTQFIKQLHDVNMKWLSAIEPHQFYTKDANFLHHWQNKTLLNSNNEPYFGKFITCNKNEIDQQDAFYPDFFNPEASELYGNIELNLSADGLILDWNTPINFADNLCQNMANDYKWNYFYFSLLNDNNPCLDVKFSQSNLFPSNLSIIGPYLSLHNLYGFKHMEAVYKKLINSNYPKRPFIMSMSTFIGSGRFGGHLSSHINSTWEMLRLSVKQMLDFSLFAIPMTAFSVGGYRGKLSTHLLRHWYQLASMQPFMIAYSGPNQIDTPLLEQLKTTIKRSIKMRYQILPYLYTLFYKAHKFGDLVAQPLFIQFPHIKAAYKIDAQYMLGPALMITPILHEEPTSIKVFFPKGRWYDFYSGQILWNSNSSEYMELPVVQVNIHLKGGEVVFTQNSETTITETREKHGFSIISAFNTNHTANGDLYIDDGISPMPAKNFMLIYFQANYTNINITIKEWNFCQAFNMGKIPKFNTTIESIKLYGIIDQPYHNKVILNNVNTSNNTMNISDEKMEIIFDSKHGALIIRLHLNICKNIEQDIDQYIFSWEIN